MGRRYNFQKVNEPILRDEVAKEKIQKLLEDDRALFIKAQTTGLGDDARVISLTLMRGDGGWEKHTFSPGFEITDETVKYTGLSKEEVAESPTWAESEVSRVIADLLGGCRITGWNVDFDVRALRREQKMVTPEDDPFAFVTGISDVMELYSGAIGRDTRFTKLSVALGKAAPVDPVEYLEAVIDLMRRVSA